MTTETIPSEAKTPEITQKVDNVTPLDRDIDLDKVQQLDRLDVIIKDHKCTLYDLFGDLGKIQKEINSFTEDLNSLQKQRAILIDQIYNPIISQS